MKKPTREQRKKSREKGARSLPPLVSAREEAVVIPFNRADRESTERGPTSPKRHPDATEAQAEHEEPRARFRTAKLKRAPNRVMFLFAGLIAVALVIVVLAQRGPTKPAATSSGNDAKSHVPADEKSRPSTPSPAAHELPTAPPIDSSPPTIVTADKAPAAAEPTRAAEAAGSPPPPPSMPASAAKPPATKGPASTPVTSKPAGAPPPSKPKRTEDDVY